MARDWKHLALVLLRLGLLSLLGMSVMVGGVAILLKGAWLGILLIFSGAILMAVPAALCATQFLCTKLYGKSLNPSAPVDPTESADEAIKPVGGKPSAFGTLRAWLSAEAHGVHLPLWEVMSMRARGTPPDIIVDAYVMISRSGMPTAIASLEDIYITERHRIHSAFDLVHIVTGIKD